MAHIKSFNELGGGSDSDDSMDSGDKTNEYYAGGAKSGQVVRGAKDDNPDKVASLFDKARAAGAQQGSAADVEPPAGAFKGTSNRLEGGPSQAPTSSGPVNHVIVFYRNGVFTVNDGPPRRVDDRANFAFIESISKGECPDELEPGTPGAPVNVNLVRKEEDYAEPEKPKMSAFTGQGQTLAGGSSDAAALASASAASASAASSGEWTGADECKPTTSLQLRLSDGSRMVAKFNCTHKVSDIRRFIQAAHPEMTISYQLMTAFPSQLIVDETKSLEEAGLLNAVIIQKKL
eukprot:gene29009-32200_t